MATIRPFVGVDGLAFGSTREAVRSQIGSPDSVEPADVGNDNPWEIWVYVGRGVDLVFDSEYDYLLSSITVRGTDTELMGRRLVGLEEQVFLATARADGLQVDLRDEFPIIHCRDYACDDLNLGFWVCEGFLENIHVMPRYDDADGHPIWPSHRAVNHGVEADRNA